MSLRKYNTELKWANHESLTGIWYCLWYWQKYIGAVCRYSIMLILSLLWHKGVQNKACICCMHAHQWQHSNTVESWQNAYRQIGHEAFSHATPGSRSIGRGFEPCWGSIPVSWTGRKIINAQWCMGLSMVLAPKRPLGMNREELGVSPIPGFCLALVSLYSAKI